MIKSLEMKCFRKHTDTALEFSKGLNVLRGPNEIGKTTVTEALLYALYGAKSLRNPLSDTVTWGRKESELKVKLVINISGIDYTFTRSKSGAECLYNDGKSIGLVSGQAETTSHAVGLLGADARTAALLMLSSQSGLRGSLDDGPAAVSALMGKLADFDLIDRLLETAQNTMTLGADAPLRTRLEDAEAGLAEERALLVEPDLNRQARIEALTGKLAAAQTDLEVIFKDLQKAENTLDAAQTHNSDRADALAQVNLQEQAVVDERTKLSAAAVAAAAPVDLARLKELRSMLASAAEQQRVVGLYAKFLERPTYPAEFWDENKESFQAELARQAALEKASSDQVQQLMGQIKTLEGQKITNGKCPTCGSTQKSDEHVLEHNSGIDSDIFSMRMKIKALERDQAAVTGDLKTLNEIDKVAGRIEAHANLYADFISWDISVYPRRLSWNGPAPTASPTATLQSEVDALEQAQRAATLAQGRVTAHQEALKQHEANLAKAMEKLVGLAFIETKPLSEAHDYFYIKYTEKSGEVDTLRADIRAEAELHQAQQHRYREQLTKVEYLDKRVAEYKEELTTLSFNNNLIKKLRGLKPAITDYLWNTVLSAVSNFFSTLRGEQSVVTKDATGFRVNGQSIESLSGSTLDVLALAIRVALSKTFVPHAAFLVLDEPAHGCDTSRTGNVLGFLASCGFEQTVLASHDELSESVADRVILLGA